ncbi:MAG: RelA/SpoT family protein [Pseudomonadota bacterium]
MSKQAPYHEFLASSQDRDHFSIDDLMPVLKTYMDEEGLALVHDAYLLAAQAHSGQTRLTGEAYIYHPVSVARVLGELRIDAHTVAAAVLHDVIEDTEIEKAALAERFGKTVAELVDGVSKLEKIQFESREEAAAASFRKMMLAMVSDVRVILIKLADRLHNMRTLNVMRPEKRRRIARETLEVYAPIAMRLGINSLRLELEDLGFRAMHPLRYRTLASYIQRTRKHRKEVMTSVEISFKAQMEEAGIEGNVVAREKHLYSVYRKMQRKRLRIADIMDLFALRVVVKSIDDCYRTLGIAHSIHKPLPDRFKDYIAIPKTNGYQALHTILFGPGGMPVEVQIRTEEMDKFAESGIAAHWIYKSDEAPQINAHHRAQRWLQDVLEMQQSAGDSIEFLENVKLDLFPDDVYVFTPKGRIMELPAGSTPIDFAYALHTDIGDRCTGAKVDRQMVPLSSKLASGQTVHILTSKGARPNPAWLNFVVTAKARAGIRHYLKNLASEDSITLGRRLLRQALKAYGVRLEDVPQKTWDIVVDEYDYHSVDELLGQIGFGNRVPSLVARRIAPSDRTGPSLPGVDPIEGTGLPAITKLDIKGTEGLVVSYAKCCRPIPGDHIVAVISTGRGLVVHRKKCRNLPDASKRPGAVLEVDWDDEVDALFPVGIRVSTINRRGTLARVATIITESGCDIEHVDFNERDGTTAGIIFEITVSGRKMLADLIRRLRRTEGVLKVARLRG